MNNIDLSTRGLQSMALTKRTVKQAKLFLGTSPETIRLISPAEIHAIHDHVCQAFQDLLSKCEGSPEGPPFCGGVGDVAPE